MKEMITDQHALVDLLQAHVDHLKSIGKARSRTNVDLDEVAGPPLRYSPTEGEHSARFEERVDELWERYHTGHGCCGWTLDEMPIEATLELEYGRTGELVPAYMILHLLAHANLAGAMHFQREEGTLWVRSNVAFEEQFGREALVRLRAWDAALS